jgi:hypothetical protein
MVSVKKIGSKPNASCRRFTSRVVLKPFNHEKKTNTDRAAQKNFPWPSPFSSPSSLVLPALRGGA